MSSSDNHPIHKLNGNSVCQVRFSLIGAAVRLVFCGEYEQISELSFRGVATLERGENVTFLENTKNGAALLELLGTTVMHIALDRNWELSIFFSNKLRLHLGLDDFSYPVWEFRHGKGIVSLI